jgi:mannosyltransferase OCH1-like enzyme
MIPRIIHQSWKVEQVPERWLAFQQSWRTNHPGYEYRFWTDEANRAFVAELFPEFLSIYDGYKHAVSRADLARVLVVYHYGGIYADLDCESLKPLDDLLAGRGLVFGLEPASHVKKPAVASRGFTRVVCNALFASVPHHPFWQHLFPMLMASKDEGNVLECAGPFVLTRACDSYPRPQEITILPSDVLYPLDNYLQPATSDGEAAANRDQRPYAVHHWAGTWWRSAVINNARRRILAARAASKPGENP